VLTKDKVTHCFISRSVNIAGLGHGTWIRTSNKWSSLCRFQAVLL